ncbi:hypothetical protein RHGRI_013995 [Rhododendron griersonianum]|uniref:Small ribosomal subunit protein uS17 n=1 Tax=Rhododendron griersonianum TaxID=479676 RepID=A0AAV6K871_9ERIC|nr:hypothetical protein RHGRI_013995 [Rhododendron griersonianum]
MLSLCCCARVSFQPLSHFLLPSHLPFCSSPHSTMAEQTEKAFLKQPKVFLRGFRPVIVIDVFAARRKQERGRGLEREAIGTSRMSAWGSRLPEKQLMCVLLILAYEGGTYIDKKCPFTGNVSIRGRIISGTCHSAKMMRTIIVRRNYLHYVKKYQRYEKRHSNIPAHVSPCFRVKEGDHITIGQCRPLSKTVRFNVLKVIPAGSSGSGKKAFTAI